jgi:hypothetical protein
MGPVAGLVPVEMRADLICWLRVLPLVVESRCGAVALGCTYPFPPLSSGGALVV